MISHDLYTCSVVTGGGDIVGCSSTDDDVSDKDVITAVVCAGMEIETVGAIELSGITVAIDRVVG